MRKRRKKRRPSGANFFSSVQITSRSKVTSGSKLQLLVVVIIQSLLLVVFAVGALEPMLQTHQVHGASGPICGPLRVVSSLANATRRIEEEPTLLRKQQQQQQSVLNSSADKQEIETRKSRGRREAEAQDNIRNGQELSMEMVANVTHNLPLASGVVWSQLRARVELTCDVSAATQNRIANDDDESQQFVVGPNGTLLFAQDFATSKIVQQSSYTLRTHEESSSDLNDHLVSLIFWYKDSNPAPIYTLDARPSTGRVLNEFADEQRKRTKKVNDLEQINELNRRLLSAARHYQASEPKLQQIDTNEWPSVKLRFIAASADYAGDYNCRVDFRRARTIRRTVRLILEVPLKRLELIRLDNATNLFDSTGSGSDNELVSSDMKAKHKVLRLDQDAKLELACQAFEGAPKPKLKWLVGGQLAHESPLFASLEGRISTNWTSSGVGGVGGSESVADQEAQQSNWLKSMSLAAGSSKLELRRVGRQADGVSIGCVASQTLRKADNWPPTRRSPQETTTTSNNSQGANLSAGHNSLASKVNSNRLLFHNHELAEWLKLELNLKPELVEMWRAPEGQVIASSAANSIESLAAGAVRRPIGFVCRARGSWPPARIEWLWVGVANRSTEAQIIRPNGTQTIRGSQPPSERVKGEIINEPEVASQSELMFLEGLSEWHAGAELICRATNEQMAPEGAGRSLETQVKLDVRFAPIVELFERAASNVVTQNSEQSAIAPSPSTSDSQPVLECLVKSNPAINQFVWLVDELPVARISRKTINGKPADELELFDEAEVASRRFHWPVVGGTQNASNLRVGDYELDLSQLLSLESRGTFSSFLKLVKQQQQHELFAQRQRQRRSINLINLAKWPTPTLKETTTRAQRQFKCLASNELAEGSSQLLRWAETAADSCLIDEFGMALRKRRQQQQKQIMGPLDSLLARLHQIKPSTAYAAREDNRIICYARAQIENELEWSFYSLESIASHWIELSAGGAWPEVMAGSGELKLSNSRANSLELNERLAEPGILLCRDATQTTTCAIGLVGQLDRKLSEKTMADVVANCKFEALNEDETQDERRDGTPTTTTRLTISVECPAAARLIFELGVEARERDARRDARRAAGSGPKNVTGTHFALFAGAQQYKLRVGDLAAKLRLADDYVTLQNGHGAGEQTTPGANFSSQDNNLDAAPPNPSERKFGVGGAGKLMMATLDEQVALLNELVFTLRASDLAQVASARRRIEGATLAAGRPPTRAKWAGKSQVGVAQVSRSATVAAADEPLDEPPVPLTVSGRSRNQSAATTSGFATSTGSRTTHLLEWGRQHEIGITMVAIGATLLLSALTLTLIVLVLRARKSSDHSTSGSETSTSGSSAASEHSNVGGGGLNRRTIAKSTHSPSSSDETNTTNLTGNAGADIHLYGGGGGVGVNYNHCATLVKQYTSTESSFSSPPTHQLEHECGGYVTHVLDLRCQFHEEEDDELIDNNNYILINPAEQQVVGGAPPILAKLPGYRVGGTLPGHAHYLPRPLQVEHHLSHLDLLSYNPSLQETTTATSATDAGTPTTIDFLAPPVGQRF